MINFFIYKDIGSVKVQLTEGSVFYLRNQDDGEGHAIIMTEHEFNNLNNNKEFTYFNHFEISEKGAFLLKYDCEDRFFEKLEMGGMTIGQDYLKLIPGDYRAYSNWHTTLIVLVRTEQEQLLKKTLDKYEFEDKTIYVEAKEQIYHYYILNSEERIIFEGINFNTSIADQVERIKHEIKETSERFKKMKRVKTVYNDEVVVDEKNKTLINYDNKKKKIYYNAQVIIDGYATGFYTNYFEKGTIENIEERLKVSNNSIRLAYLGRVGFNPKALDPDNNIWNSFVMKIKMNESAFFTKDGNYKKKFDIAPKSLL